ncbi:TraB/GumN family protein [Aquamicrobium sp. LC103]|uniref:TraB/GumN family protein n=1 Tax=Aquamicrobium sp. LC103 TaxID=1120658 RepID=UPI00063E8BEA|nr:TraB/GumN family protein [Aquamicrobium sp. LC103]TKT82850.1 polysaccharide biosynthesis protein GumN [Aquamicrobium sp. LC103]
MKQARSIADRAADLTLRLIAAFNLLFLACFLMVTMLAVSKARAEETIACAGTDLFTKMERDDPEKLAGIRAEAAKTENGEAVLWKVEKEGRAPSYLFGTMHMSDPRVVSLGARAQEAFDTSSTVVIETTDALDQARMMAALARQPELMMFTDGTTLSSLIPEEDRDVFAAALKERGIPPASIERMKPWMLSAMLALPACEMKRKTAGAPVLDAKLAADAQLAGKSLAGLETAADQLGAMASLPMEFHVRGLVDTLKLGDEIEDVMETMVVLYTKGETGMFWPFFRAALPGADDEAAGYAAFEETMVTARNRTMAERAAPIIDEGGAFVAVGALHLPGREGLVALLRAKGYSVTAAE